MTGRRVTPGATLVMPFEQMREDRAAWLEARRYREGIGYMIGSSDVPSILGIKDAGTPVEVWHDKVRGLEIKENAAMFWGRVHEENVARVWRDRNRAVTRAVGLIASMTEPWNQTSLDRLVLECPLTKGRATGERCALEVKTADAFAAMRWHADLPDRHLAQICHQIFVSGLDHIHYAVLKGGNDYHQGIVRRSEDSKTIDFVMRQVRAFRQTYLAGKGLEVEPPWPIQDRASKLLEMDALLHPERQETVELDSIADVRELADVRRRIADLQAEERRIKARIAEATRGARIVTTLTDRGSILVLEYTPVNRSKVDLDRLREIYPEAYADPSVVSHGKSWTMRIAKDFQVKRGAGE